MTATIQSLGLDYLNAAERVLLADELWNSISSSPDAKLLNDAHRRDLERRLDAYRDEPTVGTSWEEVKARLHGSAT